MKRYGNLWEKVISKENFREAYQKSKKNKSKFKAVIKFEKDWENNLEEVRKLLLNKEFKTAKYKRKIVFEPKKRIIYVLPYKPDRIIQHALMNVLTPIFEKLFIRDSYACIKYRGQHKGSLRCMEYVRRNKFCLKCDVKSFYPSIDQKILFEMLKRVIKDKEVLWLLEDIVFSFKDSNGKNVPIGNLTSQWFGNFYLTKLDRFVKQELKIKDYVRYCDDFCLFHNDKQYLHECKRRIEKFLKEELELRFSKSDVFNTKQGVDFLGYRHFDNYILLRKNTAKRIIRRFRELPENLKCGIITEEQYRSTISSAYGWLKHANTHNLQVKLDLYRLRKEIEVKILEERRIRKEQKRKEKEEKERQEKSNKNPEEKKDNDR